MDPLAGLADALSQCQHHYSEALRLVQQTSKKHESMRLELETASKTVDDQERQISTLRNDTTSLKETIEGLKRELQDRAGAHLEDDDAAIRKTSKDVLSQYTPEKAIDLFDPTPEVVTYEHYSRLAQAYRELYHESAIFVEAFHKLRQIHKTAKAKLVKWNHMVEKGRFEVVVKGEDVTFQRLDPESSDEPTILESPILPPIKTPRRQLPLEVHPFKPPSPPQPSEHLSEPASTQSQDLRYDGLPLPPPESPDIPTIIQERPVRRKRGKAPTSHSVKIENPHDLADRGTAEKPVDIKSEPLLSSPVPIASIPQHTGERTPVSSPTFDPIDPPPSSRPKLTVHTDQQDSTPVPRKAQLEDQSTERQTKKRSRRALQSVDVNVTPSRKSSKDPAEPRSKRRRPDFSRGAHAIPSVAEDGEAEEYLTRSRTLRSSTTASVKTNTPARKPLQTRLTNLLENEHTPRPILISTPRAVSKQPAIPRNSNDTVEVERSPVAPNPDAAQRLDPFKAVTLAHSHDRGLSEVRYRDKSVHDLSLEHFKLNPHRNQGLDYAFVEVVRDKSLRKQLRGCLRQECCGPIYRRMARDELGEAPRPLKSLNSAELDLLREDLGNNFKQILEDSSPIQIRDMLLEAKACLLSNKYSKHRSAHARGSTPPGYWRTEMPSTQEVELDRKAAEKLEREKVLERYKEACKDDGYWKFADE